MEMEALNHKSRNPYQGYKENEILNASPVQLVLKLYDYVIVACKKKDLQKVNAGLIQLITSLNFEYKDISLGFFKLYRYCQEQARKGNFEEAENIISELRESWAEAFKLK
jgi:flagellar protein FliS